MEYLSYSELDVIERVDEYSLYCFYLQFEPIIKKDYSSPIRKGDDNPSFGIWESRRATDIMEFYWKDSAMSLHGPQDLFDLVKYMFGLPTRQQSIWKVCADFGLGGALPANGEPLELYTHIPEYMEPVNIRVKSQKLTTRDKLYWKQFNVDERILTSYNCKSLECYWMVESQQFPTYPKGGLAYSYGVYDKHQVYQPFADRRYKFRNDWTELCVPGIQQLKHTDLLIITKAVKDVMCIRSFGIDAICPRGENIMLPADCISGVNKRYSTVVTLFDNDGKHKAQHYPFRETHVPLSTGTKDLTDFCSRFGVVETEKLLKQLIDG